MTSITNGLFDIGSGYLNQQLSPNDFLESGTWWEMIDTVTVDSLLRVQLTDQGANGYAIADAIRIEKVVSSQIVDNMSPAFQKLGTWSTFTNTGYGGSIFLPATPHDGAESATWNFTVEPGVYQIATTWHGGNPVHGTNVPIQVFDEGSQIASVALNQSISPGEFLSNAKWWKVLGTYKIAGTKIQVRMSDLANGYAIADAMRVERVAVATPVAKEDFYFTPGTNLVVTTTSTSLPLLANDVGMEGSIWAKIVSYPINGTLSQFGNNGTFTYIPSVPGEDSFSYKITDGLLESPPTRVSITVGTHLLGRRNLDSNVLNPWTPDPWLFSSVLEPFTPSDGLGMGYSNIPSGSSQETEGGLATTGGLQLMEDLLPGMALVYRSNSLTKPVIAIDTQLTPNISVPSSITAQLTLNGVAGPLIAYSTAGLQTGQPIRFALQADGSSLPTGMYDYMVEVITVVGGSARSHTFLGKQAIVNRSVSEFGAGWSLDGLDRLHDHAQGALIVRGNGDSFWFPKSGTSYLHAAGDLSFSALVKNGDGTFTLTSKTGIVSTYSALGLWY